MPKGRTDKTSGRSVRGRPGQTSTPPGPGTTQSEGGNTPTHADDSKQEPPHANTPADTQHWQSGRVPPQNQ